jgi:hypothetical protein
VVYIAAIVKLSLCAVAAALTALTVNVHVPV